MRNQPMLGLIVILVAVAVTACSRLNVAYRNMDTLIPWTLDDYLDIDRDQRQHLKAHVREHLDWHCRTQLPAYLDTLQQLRQQVVSAQVTPQALHGHYREAREAVEQIAERITPSSIALLRQLSDRQVEELGQALDEDRREREEKYLEPSAEEQVRERAKRMQKRVETWFGSTSAAQRQRILAWSHALAGQNRLWLENRSQWQQTFLEAVRQRHQAGFEARMAQLLQDRQSLWTAEYRQAFGHAEQAGIALFSDLYELSDEAQRRHLTQQLGELDKDLGSLECLPQTAAR